jgi:hypothetical protein
VAALDLHAKVARLLSSLKNGSGFDKVAVNNEFMAYVNMIAIINDYNYLLVATFGPTILEMLNFQHKQRLGSTLTASLAMRLQLPGGTHSEVVRAASIAEAAFQMRLPENSRKFENPTVHGFRSEERKKPVLVFYLYDLGNHPLAYLMLELLLRMFDRDKVEIYILVLCKANQCEYAPFMTELKTKFHRRWQEYARTPLGLAAARRFLRKHRPTIFWDLVGNMHGRYDCIPEHCDGQMIVHYVNTGCKMFDSRYHFGIFDPGMLAGMPKDWDIEVPENGSGEECKVINLWQPALPGSLLDKVDWSLKHSFSSGRFNILLDVYLDRAGEATGAVLEILKLHRDVYLHIQASPVSLITVILESARKLEEANGMLAGTIESRIVPWRRQPMEEFTKNLRAKEIHLAISHGSHPD